jgi:hypothetical protein
VHIHYRQTLGMAATVDAKLLRATKFPIEFNQKVDMQKVNLQVMKKYADVRYHPFFLPHLTAANVPQMDSQQDI